MKFSEIEAKALEQDILFASPSIPNFRFAYTKGRPIEVSHLWSPANKDYFNSLGRKTTFVSGYYTMIDSNFDVIILGSEVPLSKLINDWYIIGE
jgi:hypothetical protein